jgi:hypothetical protein
MSTFKTKTEVDLDPQWVEDLLVTAFDGQYGGCNYWLNEEEAAGSVHGIKVLTNGGRWYAVRLTIDRDFETPGHAGPQGPADRGRDWVLIDKEALEKAWAIIVDTRPIRSDLVDQFTRSMYENDLDVDAEAADCLVQIALFGEVIYG